MKKKQTKMALQKQVISALTTTNIMGGQKRATQSDQAFTGCHTNCRTDNCQIA